MTNAAYRAQLCLRIDLLRFSFHQMTILRQTFPSFELGLSDGQRLANLKLAPAVGEGMCHCWPDHLVSPAAIQYRSKYFSSV